MVYDTAPETKKRGPFFSKCRKWNFSESGRFGAKISIYWIFFNFFRRNFLISSIFPHLPPHPTSHLIQTKLKRCAPKSSTFCFLKLPNSPLLANFMEKSNFQKSGKIAKKSIFDSSVRGAQTKFWNSRSAEIIFSSRSTNSHQKPIFPM